MKTEARVLVSSVQSEWLMPTQSKASEARIRTMAMNASSTLRGSPVSLFSFFYWRPLHVESKELVVGVVLGRAVERVLAGYLQLIFPVAWHWALPKGHLLPLPLTWSKEPKALFKLIEIMGWPWLPMPTPWQAAPCLWLCCGASPRHTEGKARRDCEITWGHVRIKFYAAAGHPRFGHHYLCFVQVVLPERCLDTKGTLLWPDVILSSLHGHQREKDAEVLQGCDSSPPKDELSVWRNELHHGSACSSPETERVPSWHAAVSVGGHLGECHPQKADTCCFPPDIVL